MNAKHTALDAYLARTVAIHEKPERLQQLAEDHFGHDPDAINWRHVGDLGRVEDGLGELLAIIGKSLNLTAKCALLGLLSKWMRLLCSWWQIIAKML